MRYGETPQGAQEAPETLQRLTDEGAVAVRSLFVDITSRYSGLADFYANRFGPDNLIALSEAEKTAASKYVVPPGAPIVAEEVSPRVIRLGSFEGGW